MKREVLTPACALALLIGGCPKRQTTPRLVYVPSPPPSAVPAQTRTNETLVIEEPPPPPPPEPLVIYSPAPAPAQPAPRKQSRVETQVTDETGDVPATPAPALQPRESAEKQRELYQEVVGLQKNIQGRIAHLQFQVERSQDRKTLEDARAFLVQSLKAKQDGDLERSQSLAKKASLLLAALEQEGK